MNEPTDHFTETDDQVIERLQAAVQVSPEKEMEIRDVISKTPQPSLDGVELVLRAAFDNAVSNLSVDQAPWSTLISTMAEIAATLQGDARFIYQTSVLAAIVLEMGTITYLMNLCLSNGITMDQQYFRHWTWHHGAQADEGFDNLKQVLAVREALKNDSAP